MRPNEVRDPARRAAARKRVTHAERRKNAGFVRKTVWVHKHDVEPFQEYVEGMAHNHLWKGIQK